MSSDSGVGAVAALPREWTAYVTDDGDVVERCWASFESGAIPWSDLDDMELARAKLRAANGKFNNASRNVAPQRLVRALVAEGMRRFEERNRELLPLMQVVVRDIALGDVPGATPADQFKAATYVMERVVGKVPDKVEVTAVVKPWEGVVGSILVDDIEDAEVVGTLELAEGAAG